MVVVVVLPSEPVTAMMGQGQTRKKAGAYALDAAAVAVVVGDVCAVYLATSSHTQDYTMFCNA